MNRTANIAPPNSPVPQADWLRGNGSQFTLRSFRLCAECDLVDGLMMFTNCEIYMINLIVMLEQMHEVDPFVLASMVLVLDHDQGGLPFHLGVENVELLQKHHPQGLGGLNWGDNKLQRAVLFPD